MQYYYMKEVYVLFDCTVKCELYNSCYTVCHFKISSATMNLSLFLALLQYLIKSRAYISNFIMAQQYFMDNCGNF